MLRDLIARVGADRSLRNGELDSDGSPFLHPVWALYTERFDGFTGARVDSQFARLDHPARTAAHPKVGPGTTIVIAGAGPSLAARIDELRRLRARLSLWTSIRGAEALAAHGLDADLVIVQHASDLDAYLTLRHLRDRNGFTPWSTAPVVLAEPRTPAALLASVDAARIATFDPAYGWGLWPATLAWMACGAGAHAVALAGIDLGTPGVVDPLHAPLCTLLGVIADGSPVTTVDLGHGAIKAGWPVQPLDDVIDATGCRDVILDARRWTSADERLAALESSRIGLRDHLETAEMFRSRAVEARASRDRGHDGPLGEALAMLLNWRESSAIRVAFQEELGVTFLPRFWRHDEARVPGPLWRPVLLATDEIVRQSQRAAARIARRDVVTS